MNKQSIRNRLKQQAWVVCVRLDVGWIYSPCWKRLMELQNIHALRMNFPLRCIEYAIQLLRSVFRRFYYNMGSIRSLLNVYHTRCVVATWFNHVAMQIHFALQANLKLMVSRLYPAQFYLISLDWSNVYKEVWLSESSSIPLDNCKSRQPVCDGMTASFTHNVGPKSRDWPRWWQALSRTYSSLVNWNRCFIRWLIMARLLLLATRLQLPILICVSYHKKGF